MVDIPSVPNVQQLSIVAVDATGQLVEIDDLSDQYINCVLKQSLFSPEIHLVITLSESKGSLTRFNKVGYQGQEFVFLKFTNSLDTDQENLITMQFWVEKISGINVEQSKQSSAFILHCVSKEGLINGIQGVNQSFNSTYTDAVEKIFRNYIEVPTKGYFKSLQSQNFWTIPSYTKPPESPSDITNKFIVPGLNPYKAIEFCARRNYERYGQEKYKGASWSFYADWNHTFRFENLEHLIKQGKEDPIELYMAALPDSSESNPEDKIKEMNKIEPLDNRYNTFEGVYHNTVTAVDYYGKRWKNTSFNIIGNESEFQKLGKRIALDKDWLNTFVKDSQHSQLFFKDTTKFNAPASQNYEDILTKRRYFFSSLYNTRCEIILEGRNDITAGQVVNIDMPEASANEDEPTRAETKFSGYWLIDSVVHSWSQAEHNTRLTLLKDTPTNVG
tara:strand:+ start:1777 stop:3111 length:1335 start_codon:yes stop_codon:yes gene_type:complete